MLRRVLASDGHSAARLLRVVLVGWVALLLVSSAAEAAPWRFGILADTQWRVADDGQSPNTVPAGILKQVHAEFLRHEVKFVVALGDTADRSSKANLDARARYAQALYNAGIGFYPLRGNHDAGWGGAEGSGPEFQFLYPQTRDGVNNATPSLPEDLGVEGSMAPDPKTKSETFLVGTNFCSPQMTFGSVSMAGLTYSFDFEDARLVLLDQFGDSSERRGSTIAAQQDWITGRLADPQRPPHAFVFGHKDIVGSWHHDTLLGPQITPSDLGDATGLDPDGLTPEQQVAAAKKRAATECFLVSLAAYGVDYYVCGHEHQHLYGLVSAPSGAARVRQLIAQGASTNFPIPTGPTSPHLVPIAQHTAKIAYYICTVDGPRVTIDCYGAAVTPVGGQIRQTPDLTGQWQKLDTIGRSLNGREFVIPPGTSYTVVRDDTSKAIANGEQGYRGTQASILVGENQSTATALNGVPLVKAVNTGWAAAEGTASDLLTLWGLAELGAPQTDPYVLAMTVPAEAELPAEPLESGHIVLATRNAEGQWINAVAANVATTADDTPAASRFVLGPYQTEYGLGVYGFDPATHTAWAVVNHAGQFAVTTLER